MVQIMEKLQLYVPKSGGEELMEVEGRAVSIDTETFVPILIGSDQLTAARARGASTY